MNDKLNEQTSVAIMREIIELLDNKWEAHHFTGSKNWFIVYMEQFIICAFFKDDKVIFGPDRHMNMHSFSLSDPQAFEKCSKYLDKYRVDKFKTRRKHASRHGKNLGGKTKTQKRNQKGV